MRRATDWGSPSTARSRRRRRSGWAISSMPTTRPLAIVTQSARTRRPRGVERARTSAMEAMDSGCSGPPFDQCPWLSSSRFVWSRERRCAIQAGRTAPGNPVQPVRHGRPCRCCGPGNHDQPRSFAAASHHADRRAGDTLSTRAGIDLSRAARIRSPCDFDVATAPWVVGASSRGVPCSEPMISLPIGRTGVCASGRRP